MFHDIGKFLSYYFQALACWSIAWMILSPLLFDRGYLDLSFLFLFWASLGLRRHHPAARRWTIGVCGVFLAVLVAGFLYAAIAGTQGTSVTLGERIENPALWQLALGTGILVVLVGLPFILLLTPQARREFQRPAGG